MTPSMAESSSDGLLESLVLTIAENESTVKNHLSSTPAGNEDISSPGIGGPLTLFKDIKLDSKGRVLLYDHSTSKWNIAPTSHPAVACPGSDWGKWFYDFKKKNFFEGSENERKTMTLQLPRNGVFLSMRRARILQARRDEFGLETPAQETVSKSYDLLE
jgi:hypothetical protein